MAADRHIGETILDADRISLSFGGIQALNEVSLAIREHEILAIIGPNGAGKTSLLNVINGFYHPQHGTLSTDGCILTRSGPRGHRRTERNANKVNAAVPAVERNRVLQATVKPARPG